MAAAEKSILRFLDFKPRDQIYNNNLVLLYKDMGRYQDALARADTMMARGLEVNQGLYQSLSDSVKNQK